MKADANNAALNNRTASLLQLTEHNRDHIVAHPQGRFLTSHPEPALHHPLTPPRRHLGLLLAYGPEVRSFLYSGLVDRLAADYRISVFFLGPSNRMPQLPNLRCEMLPIAPSKEPKFLRKWRDISARLHRDWMALQGNPQWGCFLRQHAGQGRGGTLLRWTGRYPVVPAAAVTERWLARAAGTDVRWRDVYSRLGIDAILTSVMDSRTLPALQTAVNCGKAVLWVANSWKDVYIRSHLPVVPAAAVVCGPKEREILVRGNPAFDSNRVHVGGSLHLTPIKEPSRIMPRDAFCRQSGLDPDRPYICYTSASPAAVRNEEQIVTALADCIRTREFPNDPQLLVRLNPMEDGQRFRHLADRPDVVLQKPAWDWCPEEDWNSPHEHDLDCRASTVYHAALNVSIASTVTLEFAVWHRPVINICFDLPTPLSPDSSNAHFLASRLLLRGERFRGCGPGLLDA